MMEGKKISFGFKKTKKAETLVPVVEEKKEFIECVEENAIKVIGKEVTEDSPLIIPLKPNTLVTTERLKQIAQEVESAVNEPEEVKTETPDVETPKNETLDQMAVRELLQDAKKETSTKGPELVVPVPSLPPLEGQKESTLDDYDAVPVQQFGLAMLRGMGWTPGKEQLKYKEPPLRPKGLGLGADKVIKQEQKTQKEDGKDLMIVKNAYVKITSGKYAGFYGKVLSLDEDNGRVMVDIAVKKETVSLSEFMMHPVTKSEFDKQSKVINADKYEEYKNKETSSQQKQESSSDSKTKSERDIKREERDRNNGDKYENRDKSNHRDVNDHRDKSHHRDRREDESSYRRKEERDKRCNEKDRSRNKEHRRNRSRSRSVDKQRRKRNCSSESSHSEVERSKKSNKERRNSTSSESDDYKHKSKRDTDKKRKGKKKKRDRDRSPNYRKHRK